MPKVPTDRHRRTHHDSSDKPRKRRRSSSPQKSVVLPFKAPTLSRRDLDSYKPLFASYFDIQKQKDIFELGPEEVKGRWKSFYHKWNRGELAQGWYDPDIKAKADVEWAAQDEPSENQRPEPEQTRQHADADSDSDVGPSPAPVTFETIAERDEARDADALARRTELQRARQADRKMQKEQLDDLAPRAEAGTKERMLEKKREAGAAAKGYREAKAGAGEIAEVNEKDLMGGGGDDMKAQIKQEQVRRNEREQKRAEIWEARKAEREERMKGAKEKEAKTMDMFRRMASERFGSGGVDQKHVAVREQERFDASVKNKFR